MRALIVSMLVVGMPAGAVAQEASGFGEVRGIWYAGTDDLAVTFVERFRPTFEMPLSKRVTLTSTIETALQQGWSQQKGFQSVMEASDFGPLLDAAGCAWPEEDNAFLGISGASDVFQVDRLFVDFYMPKYDVRLGRQALQWGSAQFINPTDPFPELLLMEPWRPRSGVNAALVTVPFGDVHDMNVAVATTDTFDAVRVASRLRVNWRGTDFALVGAYRGDADDGIVGLDIRGTLGLGYWIESAVHLQRDPWFEMVVGLDYSFPIMENLVLSGQYYYNGGVGMAPTGMFTVLEGPECDVDITEAFGETAAEPQKFGPMLSGQHYGLFAANLGILQELGVQFAWLQNFDDGTAFGISTVSVRPNGWLELSLSTQIPARVWGNGGEFSPAEDTLRIEQPSGVEGEPLIADFFQDLHPMPLLFFGLGQIFRS